MKLNQQIYPKQIAQTVASILGLEFKANHTVSEPITLPSTDIYEKPINVPGNHGEKPSTSF